MADTSSGNPYLALLQQEAQPPGWAQILQHIGNLGFGLAGGFGQAATTGQPTMAGIGPGLMMGNQLNAQAAQQAEQERMKRLEWQFRAQEHEDKRAEMLRKQKASEDFAKTLGFSVTPQQGPLMGPGGTPPTGTPSSTTQPGPDLKTGGAPLADYLVAQHGLSPLAASTIVGNLYQESGFNPAATGDSGSAFGMAQWRLDRQTGLRNFAATQNKPVTDPQVQLDYLVSEMKGGDMGAQRAWAGLQQAKTPEQANAAIMHFFRPQGYTPANPTGGHGYGARVANTRALLPQSRPGDPATAPVPGVTPDPDEAAPVPPAGPAPRPGLGPRATPPVAPPPEGVPVAQGGGEGEVVLPRLGLPFPAPARAPAPPGSVPFPTVTPAAPAAQGQPAPGGPVQPNYTPTPQTPSMAPAAPPTRPPTPQVPPDPNFVKQLQLGIATGQINEAKAIELLNQHNADRRKEAGAVLDAQHQTNLEVYKQGEEGRRNARAEEQRLKAEERAQARLLEAEQRRAEGEQQRHERTIAEQQKVREDAAKASGDKLAFEQTKAMRDDENKLRDDFNAAPPVKSYRIVVPMLESAKDAEKRPTRAADLNLVYAFAKLMDPDSVVRESETAGVVATASVADRLSAYVGQLNGQAMLNPDVRAKLMKELDSRFRALEESYLVHERAYAGLAERRGYNRDNIIMPIRGPKPAEANTGDVPVYDTSGKRIK
jgi:hypothetical protein